MNTLLRRSGLTLLLTAGLSVSDRAGADELTCEAPRSTYKICVPERGPCCISRWWCSLAPPNAPIAEAAAILPVAAPGLQQVTFSRDMRFSASASTPGANFNAGAGSRCGQPAAAAAPESNCANSSGAAAAAETDCRASSSRRSAAATAGTAGAASDDQVQRLQQTVQKLEKDLGDTSAQLGRIEALLERLPKK